MPPRKKTTTKAAATALTRLAFTTAAAQLDSYAHPYRLALVAKLATADGVARTVNELHAAVSTDGWSKARPTTTHHLQLLAKAGAVTVSTQRTPGIGGPAHSVYTLAVDPTVVFDAVVELLGGTV